MAGVARKMCFCNSFRSNNVLRSIISRQPNFVPSCGVKRWRRPVFQELYRRRLKQGPEPERHRSEWINWNYDSEIFSFGKRLGEEFQAETLTVAFTHRSYLDKERELRQKLEMSSETSETEEVDIQDNAELVHKGQKLLCEYIQAYLRHTFPALPEEGISAITSHLTTDDLLSYVGSNIGIKDLILCAEFPPSVSTLSTTLKAVIGGLANDQGEERAHLFVQDFIITQLVGKDLLELWPMVNPMGILQGIVTAQGGSDIESRLMFETGKSTIFSSYMVGAYSNKQLLGKGYGETVTIAEEMAARDALRRIFNVANGHTPLPFSKKGHDMEVNMNRVNSTLNDYTRPNQLQ